MMVYTRNVRFDPADLYDENGIMRDIRDIPKDARLALMGVDTSEVIKETNDEKATILTRNNKIKYPDKRASADSAARIFGMIKDKPADPVAPIIKAEDILTVVRELMKDLKKEAA
jgi:hypothetical protein